MKIPLPLFCVATALAFSMQTHAQSITDTTNQTNTQQQLTNTPSDPAELTATPWDFTGQGTLPSIGFISITLTLQDGNSAIGEFDFNHLFLALDGVNTGLKLNGFRGGFEDTLTISGTITPAISTALLAQFGDSMFAGSIVSDNPQDTALAPNDIFVGNTASNATTTLTLSAVPEPGTIGLIGLGLVLGIAPQVRRLRRRL